MNTDNEERIRRSLHEWSDYAPHDPRLHVTVLSRAGSASGSPSDRASVKRLLIPAVAAGVAAAAVVVGALVVERPAQNAAAPISARPSLSAEEVEELTRLGGHGAAWDDEKVEQAWAQKWGLPAIGEVTDSIRAAAEVYPQADAGLTYDPDTLTYTQWVVGGAAAGTHLRTAVQSAFDEAAGGSNIRLDFAVATASDDASKELMDELVLAYRNDPGWPEGLTLTGDWSPSEGRFVLPVGERFRDPEVAAYFDRTWSGVVLLTPEVPALQQ